MEYVSVAKMCKHCNRSKGNGTEGTYKDYKANAVR